MVSLGCTVKHETFVMDKNAITMVLVKMAYQSTPVFVMVNISEGIVKREITVISNYATAMEVAVISKVDTFANVNLDSMELTVMKEIIVFKILVKMEALVNSKLMDTSANARLNFKG